MTRFQKERWTEKDQAYPKIDAKFLKEPKYSQASVLHPLPRVGELDAAIDSDSRAVYFQQAAYGVPIRMALISLLLGLQKGKPLATFESGFELPKYPFYEQPILTGIRCANKNCIVHEPMEAQYVRNKFHVVKTEFSPQPRLRCFYCEYDIDDFVIAHRKNHWFTEDVDGVLRAANQSLKDFVFFADAGQAMEAGFHHRRNSAEPKAQAEGAKSS